LPTPVLPDGTRAEADGSSEARPLRLDGISKHDFKAFLIFLYPLSIEDTRQLTQEQWVSVLKLATLWQSTNIRSLAIRHLRELWDRVKDSASRVIYGYKYDVQEWIIEGYTNLAKRQKGLSAEEANLLGPEATRIVYEIRELSFKERGFFPDYRPFVNRVISQNDVPNLGHFY